MPTRTVPWPTGTPCWSTPCGSRDAGRTITELNPIRLLGIVIPAHGTKNYTPTRAAARNCLRRSVVSRWTPLNRCVFRGCAGMLVPVTVIGERPNTTVG